MFLRSCFLLFVLFSSIQLTSQVPSNFIFHLDAGEQVQKDVNNSVIKWTDPKTSITASQNLSNLQAKWIENSINNLPSLRFDGAQTYMEMPSVFPVDKDYTLVVVCQAFGPTANIVGGTSRTLWMSGATSPVALHNGDFNNQATSKLDPGLDPTLIIAQYRNSTQQVCFYINGQFADSAFCPRNIDPTIYIAAYQRGYVFNGDISEIVLYDKYIDNIDRKQMESFLIEKYKIIPLVNSDSTLVEVPKTNQLYPRNNNNNCDIPLSGNIIDSRWDSIAVVVSKEKAIFQKQGQKLKFAKGVAFFKFQFTIDAGLINYGCEVKAFSKGKDTVLYNSQNIACGDVFIITGQSNSIFGGTTETDPFCRTFGKNYSTAVKDTLWSVASAGGNGGGPNIGAWGMRLAKLLIQKYKVPICIMNGGVGGTSIQQHQRDDIQPEKPVNIYGSLLYRMQKSKLANSTKGIFWYQGESNTGNLYFENFSAIYQDWRIDYPNVEYVYVVQIHHGCGTGDNSSVREIQRQLPKTFSNIRIMSTNGLPGHDGCHYTVAGYNQLAEWLFPLVERDYYGSIPTENIDAPNLQQAYYTSSQKNEIDLLFGPANQNLVFPNDTIIQNVNVRLKDYFALDGIFEQVLSVKVIGDTIRLKLNTPGKAQKITYLTELNYLNINSTFQGPYIRNSKGIGALSFYNVPIYDQIITKSNNLNNNDCIVITSYADFINLDASKCSANNLLFQLINLQGKIIRTEKIDQAHQVIEMESLERGIYYLLVLENRELILVKNYLINLH